MKYMILATMVILALWLQADFLMKESLFLTIACWFTALCDTAFMKFLIRFITGSYPNESKIAITYVIVLFSIYIVMHGTYRLSERHAAAGKDGTI